MKLPESLFSRMFLAYLPFAVCTYPFPVSAAGSLLFWGNSKTGIAALWIVLFLWITIAFFWFTRRFFPGRSLKHAFFLWLLVWAQAAWTLSRLPPVWILSVFFLMPVSFLDDTGKARRVYLFSREMPRSQYLSISEKRKLGPSKLSFWEKKKKFGRYFFERALAGIGFAGFVMVMTLIRAVGERRLGIQTFDQPAGFLLVAAGVAFLWKKQPYGKKLGQSQDLSAERR